MNLFYTITRTAAPIKGKTYAKACVEDQCAGNDRSSGAVDLPGETDES